MRISLSAVCLVPLSLLLWRAYGSWKTRKLAFSGEALAARYESSAAAGLAGILGS